MEWSFRVRISVALGIAGALAGGCAPRQYRVANIKGLHYVFPPGARVDVARPLGPRRVPLPGLGHARGECAWKGEAFALAWVPRPVVRTELERVFEPGFNQPRMVEAVDEFRAGLENLEAQGCLRPGEAQRVLAAVADRVPLLAGETVYFRYGFNRWRNYVDLRPGMGLTLQYAFSRGPGPWGSSLADMDIGTHEYLLRPRPAAAGIDIVRAGGRITHGGAPREWIPDLSRNRLPHYRLFFLTKYLTIQGQPERSATLVGAGSVAELREYTTKFLEAADLTCRGKLTRTAPECTSVDKKISFLPEVPIVANGRARRVTLGTDVRGYLASAGAAGRPFSMERRFGAEYRKVLFPAGDEAALRLPLIDGDRLVYSPAPTKKGPASVSPGPGGQKVPF